MGVLIKLVDITRTKAGEQSNDQYGQKNNYDPNPIVAISQLKEANSKTVDKELKLQQFTRDTYVISGGFILSFQKSYKLLKCSTQFSHSYSLYLYYRIRRVIFFIFFLIKHNKDERAQTCPLILCHWIIQALRKEQNIHCLHA